MNDAIGFLASTIFFCAFTCMVWAVVTFDAIVRLEYEKYLGHWQQDQEPYGYAWAPPDAKKSMIVGLGYWKHYVRGRMFSQSLYFSAPTWIRTDPDAVRMLRRYRTLSALSITAMLASGALVLAVILRQI